jgi:hypothetical protein
VFKKMQVLLVYDHLVTIVHEQFIPMAYTSIRLATSTGTSPKQSSQMVPTVLLL